MARAEPRPFERVWTLVRSVPHGRVVTYGQIAQAIGHRLTPVGVGWAVRAAPEGLPWQRVVNARGGISTDGEHPGRQRRLLEKESVRFGPDGCIDLARYGHDFASSPPGRSRGRAARPAASPTKRGGAKPPAASAARKKRRRTSNP